LLNPDGDFLGVFNSQREKVEDLAGLSSNEEKIKDWNLQFLSQLLFF
jgi:hypothetical protein